MELVGISVLFTFFLVTPLIKAAEQKREPKPALLGIDAICFDPKEVCKKFEPCQNGGTCSLSDDKHQPYKCDCVFGYGGVNCEKKLVKLKVEAVTANRADLLITAEGEAQPAGYVVKRTNHKTMNASGSRYVGQPGGVTRIHLYPLDTYTEYSVKVKPLKFANQVGIWIDATSFKTLGIPPSFTKTPPSDIFFNPGVNLSVECSASGVPDPTVNWTRSALPLPQGRSRQKDGELRITELQIEDKGEYACEASNKFGAIKTFTTLREACSDATEFSERSRHHTVSSNRSSCDKNLTTEWYRFTGEAGTRIATSCTVKFLACGAAAAGWMNGTHPSVAEGIVTRQVCYASFFFGCCFHYNEIRVLNCGSHYIYKLVPPPSCDLRYCGA